MYSGNRTCYANFKLKLCTCAQSYALGIRTKFQLEIVAINVISGILCFRKLFWRARETLVKQPPGVPLSYHVSVHDTSGCRTWRHQQVKLIMEHDYHGIIIILSWEISRQQAEYFEGILSSTLHWRHTIVPLTYKNIIPDNGMTPVAVRLSLSRVGLLPWCRHDMDRFPHCWSLPVGTHRSPVGSPHKRSAMRSFDTFVAAVVVVIVVILTMLSRNQ